jgi:hypothetical protein
MNFPASVDVEQLDTLHPEVKDHAVLFEELGLLYHGGYKLKVNAARFLAKHSKELGTAYLTRMTRLTYDNLLATICSYYGSRLFSNQIEIDFKLNGVAKLPTKTNDFYKNFMEDCDGCGTSLERFFEQVSDEVLVYGQSLFLIDLPQLKTQPASLYEQEQMGGLSPYLAHIEPKQVYNFQRDSFGNFDWIVIHDKKINQNFLGESSYQETYTYYDRQQFAKYQMVWPIDGNRPKQGTLVDSGPHALAGRNEVPVYCVKSDNKLWIGNRIVLPLISYLNATNCQDWSLWLACVPLPVFRNGKDEKVNPNTTAAEYSSIIIPNDAEFKYVEPEGKSFEAMKDYIESQKEMIFRQAFLVALGRASSKTSTVQSGASKSMDWEPSASILNVFGNLIRTAIQDVLERIAYIREDGTVADVRGMNFSESSATQVAELNALVDALNIPSATFSKERAKRLARAYLCDANTDLIQLVCTEIEEAPVPVGAPGVPGQPGTPGMATEPTVALNISERTNSQ